MYVYKQTETNPALFTVGFYAPNGEWEAESDHGTAEEASARVHYLNGGKEIDEKLKKVSQFLADQLANHSYWIAKQNGEIEGSHHDALVSEQEWYKDKLEELLA
jgi:hypothetical protein